MVGMVDFGIVKPELAGAFGAGMQASQENRMRTEETQLKLDRLKQDQAMLTDLQTKLQAAGKSTDPNEFFKAMIQSGNPDYMAKGYEGMQRYQELQRANDLLRREAPELFGGGTPTAAAAPTATTPSIMRAAPAPTSMNALGSGTFGMGAEPTNALAAQAAAPAVVPSPVNALAAPEDRTRELRNKILLYSSSGDPRLKAMADVYKTELQELTKPQNLAPGHQLYSGGKVVYTAPAAPATPSTLARLQNEMAALPANDPRRAQYEALIRKETTHAPAISVTNVQEKAEQGARGKMLVENFDTVSKAAQLAAKTIPSIESNLNVLNNGFDTGFGTETKAAGASVLAALGVKDADKYATNAQTFLSNANAAVLQKQLEQKGPQTESDAQRINAVGAQLGKTKDANQFVLNVAKEQLKRDIEQRNFYANWYKTNKTYDGAEDAWYAGKGGESLFASPALRKYTAPTAANAAPAAGNRPSLNDIFKK